MTPKNWKAVVRSAAALMSAKRFPANVGEPADFEGPLWVGRVTDLRRLSLPALEARAGYPVIESRSRFHQLQQRLARRLLRLERTRLKHTAS